MFHLILISAILNPNQQYFLTLYEGSALCLATLAQTFCLYPPLQEMSIHRPSTIMARQILYLHLSFCFPTQLQNLLFLIDMNFNYYKREVQLFLIDALHSIYISVGKDDCICIKRTWSCSWQNGEQPPCTVYKHNFNPYFAIINTLHPPFKGQWKYSQQFQQYSESYASRRKPCLLQAIAFHCNK